MRESEVTGYSEEGCCDEVVIPDKRTKGREYLKRAGDYKWHTVYKAQVEHLDMFCSIHFKFFTIQNQLCVGIQDTYQGKWLSYCIDTHRKITHTTVDGVWELSYPVEGSFPVWLFKKRGVVYSPAFYEVEERVPNDVYGTACTPAEYAKEEVRRTIEWYEKTMKEVKKKMGDELQLIDVIFFNKKTEVIDYRENIVARDTGEAYMKAATDFGKYDIKVHIRHANCVLNFCSLKKEE